LIGGVAHADPKVPQEVADLQKILTGTWKCAGTVTLPGEPEPAAMTAVLKFKGDLDGHFIRESFEAKVGKLKLRSESFMTFDGKKWRRAEFDTFGHQMIGSSDGMKDAKIDFNLDVMSGVSAGAQVRQHCDATDPKVLKLAAEGSTDKGKTWKKVIEMTCKK
jgi:hypothetical protein